MQKHLSLLADVRGCMTRFDPLTPQIVAAQSEDGLTYEELQTVLAECGMDIRKVVFDGTRSFQNAFYADFEQGHYCWITTPELLGRSLNSMHCRCTLPGSLMMRFGWITCSSIRDTVRRSLIPPDWFW